MQKVESRFRSNMENASSPPEAVAKVILQAVMSENPELRNTVGSDASRIIQARTNMPNNEFQQMMMKDFSM